jgi:D-alanyl-D-alanine dipeptidase
MSSMEEQTLELGGRGSPGRVATRRQRRRLVVAGVTALLLAACAPAPSAEPPPQVPDLVSVAALDATIVVEARYFGSHNFVGRPVDGYEAPLCLLARPAAVALARVQAELRPFGLGLKAYDCYRPARAVAHFVRWAADPADTVMKAEFYPDLDKGRLFELGYIAERSGHSRGSTVDLTLVPLPAPPQPIWQEGDPRVACTAPVALRFRDNTLDMGTGYDCFSELSHTENPAVGALAARNRLLLRSVMEKHGFANFSQEWWHFTFRPEPYPETYFDVPVR